MEIFKIKETPKTPLFVLDFQKGHIRLEGKSILENANELFNPVIQALKRFQLNWKGNSLVEIKLDYFNTSSSKHILDILKILELIHRSGNTVNIYWYYNDEDEEMEEVGKDYKAILKAPFFVQKI